MAKQNKGETFKIILHSSKEEEELRKLADDCGADGYILKPFDVVALSEKLNNVLNPNVRYEA